jgi:ubiquitin-protein ligase
MATPRERRLASEFQSALSIRQPGGLINFVCAPLSDEEGEAFATNQINVDLLKRWKDRFVSPEDFQQAYPQQAPEKYLINFGCVGLQKKEDGEIYKNDEHTLMVVYGWDYPPEPPTLFWLTPIWHPNIDPPHLCIKGRPFSVSTTLDRICLTLGEMVQYQNYNLSDPLDREAAKWVEENKKYLPVDRRDLITGKPKNVALLVMEEEKDKEVEFIS